ncbi:MAG: DUF3592 domain-containing protein [Vicinamibacterales bacterium]
MATVLVRVFGVLLGAGGMWACVQALRAQAAARAWPTTSATVVHRGVTRVTGPNLGAPAYQFTPDVRCRYTVEGAVQEGATWYPPAVLRPPRGTVAWATRLASSVPDVTSVHYDPRTPQVAFLFFVPTWKLAAAAGAAALVALVALAM